MLFRHPTERFARTLLRKHNEFGFDELDLARPPGRFWPAGEPEIVLQSVDAARTERIPSPASLLASTPTEPIQSASRRSLAKLNAWFLLLEDRQRRLDSQTVVALAHQASLVRHCLDEPNLRRVLIADEVGLGKTVEAGLIIKELLRDAPGLRVLYLAPARLVRNVHREFARLGLPFRMWSADRETSTATLDDDKIIASIHRASHENHFDSFARSKNPWDVVIVDECHHLSAWKEGGGSAAQKYRLVAKLAERLGADGRLILLSGTPHQGHPHRFDNLLALLKGPGDDRANLAGRVIYRTKADVLDWDGRPLFPARQVNRPIEVALGQEYRSWLTRIHSFFEPNRAESDRAAGWRAGMALQWATSSVEAGLGFLVRQGIRAGLSVDDRGMRAAAEALRPYRGGPVDEPVSAVFERMKREVDRQIRHDDIEDLEDTDESVWKPDPAELGELLRMGVSLAGHEGNQKWDLLRREVLDRSENEKFVLFAQPIETVTALASRLERSYGTRPSLIIGAQSEPDREAQIRRFYDDPNVRFLVSSKAGGEGLNLQIAHRLVHLDVPWNPMELEQRVGRVHRFGSRRTIVVDTIVVSGSRETDTYRIAHEKLREIASTMVAEDRFEELFARVMSLVPPEDLQGILAAAPLAPLSQDNAQSVVKLVTEGFERWKAFDERYKGQRGSIRTLDPGAAGWDDVREFLERHSGATQVDGFETLRFRGSGREVSEESVAALVLALDKDFVALGDNDGMPVRGPDGRTATPVGLNSEMIAKLLRKIGLPEEATGSAVLGWSPAAQSAFDASSLPERFGILGFAIQQFTSTRGYGELGRTALEMFVVEPSGTFAPIALDMKRPLIRALVATTARREARDEEKDFARALVSIEERLWAQLRRPATSADSERILHGVTPLFAALVSNSGSLST